ncbi:MAG: 50S ribosomal protein L11 methyltransferase [Thermodesulfobacteriota bacterium]
MNGPYNDLYIYYLKGRPAEGTEAFDDRFIGNWQEADTAFLFFTAPADDAVDALVAGRTDIDVIDRFEMPYADWHGSAVAPFSTQRFHVAPPWDAPAGGDQDRLSIVLDPGVVFGAGTHPTTRDCLAAVEMAFEGGPVDAALDIGTGTGLLALAAARLGAKRVIAVDNNYLAARTAEDNIGHNGLHDTVLAVWGSGPDFTAVDADLLIANIHYDVMAPIVASEGFVQKKWVVLSGLLQSQAARIEQQLEERGVGLVERWISDGIWYTCLGRVSGAG